MSSEYLIKVFYAPDSNDPRDWVDRWLACVDGKSYTEEACYGSGPTIDAALAETGRKLQIISDAERDRFRTENPCPLCGQPPNRDCDACEGTGIFAGRRKEKYLAKTRVQDGIAPSNAVTKDETPRSGE